MENAFREWMADVAREYKGVVALYGLAIHGTGHWGCDAAKNVHIVTAWASGLSFSLGQEAVGEKSDEVHATQKLLKKMDLKGCTVTADALNCQRETVAAVRNVGGDYILALKNNQREVYRTVAGWWNSMDAKHVPPTRLESFTTQKHGPGREETRMCDMYSWGKDNHTMFRGWRDVHSVIRIRSCRTILATGETSENTTYYISSLPLCAERAARSIREHWSVENNLHWQLDVGFDEDDTYKRGNAAKIWSLLCKIALTAIKRHPFKGSINPKKFIRRRSMSYF